VGTVRWSAPLRSTLGMAVPVLVGIASAQRLLITHGTSTGGTVFDIFMVLLAVALLAWNVLLRVDVSDDGVAVRPIGAKLAWDQIDRFEIARGLGTSVCMIRTDGRKVRMTSYGVGASSAKELVARLEAERTAS
jgi:hypothetical protein